MKKTKMKEKKEWMKDEEEGGGEGWDETRLI